MKPRHATLAALALVAAACSSDPPGVPAGPPSATVIGRNLTVFPGAGGAIRLGFDPFEDAARLIVRFTPSRGGITLCPLTDVDGPLPDRADCLTGVGSGVRETLAATGLAGAAIVAEPAQPPLEAEFVLEYEERSRSITIAMPLLPPSAGVEDCADNACDPFFELTPTRPGDFTATATWAGPQATLVLLEGSVLGRSQRATGIPYREPARREGSAPLSIAARMQAPAEYALAFRHSGTGSSAPVIRDLRIEATWPG